VTESEARARAFYGRLGAAGLAARTRDDWDRAIVARLVDLIPRGARVLDAGCGYGRIALPLARAGCEVVGLDIAPALLVEARRHAAAANVCVALVEGSLLAIPFRAASVDVALALWSSFYELTTEDEQTAALAGIARTLRRGGWALVEGPHFGVDDAPRGGVRDGRIVSVPVGDFPCLTYRHDAESLRRTARRAGIATCNVAVDDWGGRQRQLLRFECP
jgi:SAM-dependent methyltransferase